MRPRHFLLTLFLLLAQFSAFAQNTAPTSPDMAEGLRSSGKIYVVVLVLATIFAGIIAFLIYLERRLTRLEQDMKNPA
jgi:heme/copper-type cytochrome/quinol oxidase subunit 2